MDMEKICEKDASCRYDNVRVRKPKMGLIVLQNDYTLEDDARHLLTTDSVTLHVTRIKCASEISAATLKDMEKHMTEAAELFPDQANFEAVGYGCTSAVALIGADRKMSFTQPKLNLVVWYVISSNDLWNNYSTKPYNLMPNPVLRMCNLKCEQIKTGLGNVGLGNWSMPAAKHDTSRTP